MRCKLAAVGDRVQTVRDGDRKQDLIDQMNLLHAKVTNRDPNATVPPSALPGAAGDQHNSAAPVMPPSDPGITVQPNPVGG